MSLRHRNEVGYLTITTFADGFSVFPKAEHADSLRRYFNANGFQVNASPDAGNHLLEVCGEISLGVLQSALSEWQHLYDISGGKPEEELARRELVKELMEVIADAKELFAEADEGKQRALRKSIPELQIKLNATRRDWDDDLDAMDLLLEELPEDRSNG